MNILAEPDELAERFEELLSLAHRNDEMIISREDAPIAVLTEVQEDFDQSSDRL